MRFTLIVVTTILLVGCVSMKQVEWLNQRPSEKGYYVGIARVSKKVYKNNYEKEALNMALGFLSSEIKVSVKSTSEDISKDTNGIINLDFASKTITVSNEDLEGYEIVDIKQTNKAYAIYCRLSKEKYLDTKRKKFTGQIALARETYNAYLKAVKNRNLDNALNLSLSLRPVSQSLIKNPNVLMYLTPMELTDLSDYYNLYNALISTLKIQVKTENVLPFSWCSGKHIYLTLSDSKNRLWTNWQGNLFHQGNFIYALKGKSKATVSFPSSVFVWNTESSTFTLKLQHPLGKKKDNVIKIISFSIPVSSNAIKGTIYGKYIPGSSKNNVDGLVTHFISQSVRSKFQNETKIVVRVVFSKIFSSSSWTSGKITLTFTHENINSDRSVAKVETLCAGPTIEKAINVGLGDLRKAINDNTIKWK